MFAMRLKMSGPAGATNTLPTLTTTPTYQEVRVMADTISTPAESSQQAIEYRDVPGFPAYRVGSDGSVWSCWQRISTGKSGFQRRKIGSVWKRLFAHKDKRNRLTVRLCRDGEIRRIFVHRLVLTAFVGPCPSGMEACHFPDKDTTNNAISNLRWDTRKANTADKEFHGTYPRGENNSRSKLTEEQVVEIRRLYALGSAPPFLAQQFGVSKKMIYFIVNRKNWKHLPSADFPEIERVLKGDN